MNGESDTLALDADAAEPQGRRNRRQDLIEAATQLIANKGYDATSMRDIAAACGMLPGSVYYHFPSKEELFIAAHAQAVDAIEQAVRSALVGVEDPWERLSIAAAAHLEALVAAGNRVAMVSPDAPADQAQVRVTLVRHRDSYEGLFRELVAALPLDPGADRTLLRLTLLGALNFAPTWFRPGRRAPGEIARQAVAWLKSGAGAT